jgi:hypothetical protein
MSMQTEHIIKTGLFTLSLGMAATAGAGERVTGEALKNLHAGKTWDMAHVKQGPGLIYFAPDGAVTLVRSGQTQVGKWWIDDRGEMRCHQFGGKPVCRHYEAVGDGRYVSYNESGGKEVDIHKVMDGNQLP